MAFAAAEQHPHLAVCPACREQFERLAVMDRELSNQWAAASAPPGSDCPGATVWREIAVGLTAPDETRQCLEHASRCDHCGRLLREAVSELGDLNRESTAEERKEIASLKSAGTEWQERLARRITGTAHAAANRESGPWWRKWLSVPRMAMVGAPLFAVVCAGSWFAVHQAQVRRHQPAAAEKLLAQAYTQKRTLELRMAGAVADYAPIRVSRGAGGSFTDSPKELLNAEALIASQLESQSASPSWLQAQAEADMLEGRYDAAVRTLLHATELEPQSPAILTDLATAYFQRALSQDKQDDVGAAYERLSEALGLQPENPVALFNRAIVAEHLFLYQQALDDWDHYLRVDPSSQWTPEARDHANALRQKLDEHKSEAMPLLTPAELVALASGASPPSEVDQRVEDYLGRAVRLWLPEAFPEAGMATETKPDASAAQALFFLADLTRQRHGDSWLSDVLYDSSAPHFPQAVAALARSAQAYDKGDYEVSREQAGRAHRLFLASGNVAGALRAQYAQTSAEQMERRSGECLHEASLGLKESRKYSYSWLQIQFGLEDGVCSTLLGDIGADQEAAQDAMNLAEASGYGTVYLRALQFVAGDRFAAGDATGGWKLIHRGLERYWAGQFPALQGYNLLTEVLNTTEGAGHPNLRLAMWREAVALIDTDPDLAQRAMAHRGMADAANAAHQSAEAEKEYAEAVRLIALAPQTEATRSDRVEDEILTAQMEAHQNAVDAALARLTRVQDQVQQLSLSNRYLAEVFYSALGEVQLRSHHATEAEQAFRVALPLAERNLASLISEGDRMSWSKDAAPIYLGLAEAELAQGREQEALEVFEWYLGAAQRAGVPRRGGSSIPGAAQTLAARLPLLSDQTVLAYGALPDGLAIWVYDNRGVSAKWIPGSHQELQDLSAEFYAECSNPSSEMSALRRDSQALYSRLIGPVEQRLDPKRMLAIETEGFLARLPFEALMDANGRYLITRTAIVHTPGPYAEERMHSDRAISADVPALLVGSAASSADAGLFVIPNVAAGVEETARRFHSARVLNSPEATFSAVASALPAAAVFHFAGHAATNSNHSGLMLDGNDESNGGAVLLDASGVRRLDLRKLELAVLAACSTDSGDGGSRGLDSVADAFQSAGVPHVVASRWAVDSVQTSAFTDDFYHSLLLGQPVAAATREASQRMLSTPGTAHPFYWAALAAYGRP